MKPEEKKAFDALSFIVPVIEERNLRWVITGGFACYVYGVNRGLTDIDIDVDSSKENPVFQELLKILAPRVTQPLEHFIDKNYDNYNLEVTIGGQVLDICPMADLKIFNRTMNAYEPFYEGQFPKVEIVDFFGVKLPLLAKELVVKNKEMLVWQRESDLQDIKGLRALMSQEK